MAEFLTTNKNLSAIEDIITQAKRELVLISPYVQIPDKLSRKLNDATIRGVEIILVYGKKRELNPDVKEQLAELGNITVLYRETLHAKCFFNEEQMVITSMNLYDFSEKNDEMGILLLRGAISSLHSCIADMFFLKIAFNDTRLLLAAS